MLYILHGEDEFSRSEEVAKLRRKMDPVVGDLNTVLLEGRGLSLGELQAACEAMPFMADRRLVIVRDLLSSAAGGKGARRGRREAPAVGQGPPGLEEYLPHLPEMARLVLEESRALPPSHRLLRLAGELQAYVRRFDLPKGEGLQRWIARRARGKGVGITSEAAELLATYVGPNLRLLDLELEKLSTYLGGSGTVGREEVERLVSSLQEASIFHMVDALGHRNGRRALTLLRQLLNKREAHLYLLTMMARQFRLLLMANELQARGASPAEMEREMGVTPGVLRGMLQQARNYSPAELTAALAQLLEIDVGIKTGRVEGALALELFVARWAGS